MMQASPQVSNALVPKRKYWLVSLRVFATWVVVGVLLALFSHYAFKSLVDEESEHLPHKNTEHVEASQARELNDTVIQVEQVLELVALPEPPDLDRKIIAEPQAVEVPTANKAETFAAEHKDANHTLIDAIQDQFIEQGKNLLDDRLSDIHIAFALPKAPSARNKVLSLLRECVGVRLAALTVEGDAVLAYEDAHQDRSPYARALSGSLQNALLNDEYNQAYQWQKIFGQNVQIVRVYPYAFDARWLGALNAALPSMQSAERAMIRVLGNLSLQSNALVLEGLTVNGAILEQGILLARSC